MGLKSANFCVISGRIPHVQRRPRVPFAIKGASIVVLFFRWNAVCNSRATLVADRYIEP
jgi:hypothetical protein